MVDVGLKGSTALSQAVVTGGALASFMYSSCKRHPDNHEQSLVDFDLALILTPMLLLGITAGNAHVAVFMSLLYIVNNFCADGYHFHHLHDHQEYKAVMSMHA